MIVSPTSHFIGASIAPDLFEALFDELSKYLEQFQIQDSIELQRIDSLHITLYYLDDHLSDSDIAKYREFSNSLDKRTQFGIGDIGNFARGNSPYIFYIFPSNIEYFTSQNGALSSLFHYEDVIDNQYPYIPHITILRILDPNILTLHRVSIERIIHNAISGLKNHSFPYSLGIYSVDSRIHPELQERVNIENIFDKI